MSDNSVLTCNKFLEAIFEQIRPHADNPEEFTSEWKRITASSTIRSRSLSEACPNEMSWYGSSLF